MTLRTSVLYFPEGTTHCARSRQMAVRGLFCRIMDIAFRVVFLKRERLVIHRWIVDGARVFSPSGYPGTLFSLT